MKKADYFVPQTDFKSLDMEPLMAFPESGSTVDPAPARRGMVSFAPKRG